MSQVPHYCVLSRWFASCCAIKEKKVLSLLWWEEGQYGAGQVPLIIAGSIRL